MMTIQQVVSVVAAVFILFGCAPTEPRGISAQKEDARQRGLVTGLGLESQDVADMSQKMVADILSQAMFSKVTNPSRIVVDAEFFRNESSFPFNKNILMERLRVDLNRASRGKLVFLARHQSEMVEQERMLEQAEIVSEGTKGKSRKLLGWDYRMSGRLMSQDALVRRGAQSRYFLIIFELIQRGTGKIVWTNHYEVRKAGMDDVVYR